MSVNLTKDIKAKTVSAFLKKAFAADIKRYADRASELMERAFRLYVTPEQEKEMRKQPRHFFNRNNSISCRIERDASAKEAVDMGDLNGDDLEKAIAGEAERHSYYHRGAKMAAEHPLPAQFPNVVNRSLYSDIKQFEAEYAAFAERVELARAEAMTVLNSCKTVDKLIATWPEIEEFLPADSMVKPVKWLPAKTVGGLNALLKKAA